MNKEIDWEDEQRKHEHAIKHIAIQTEDDMNRIIEKLKKVWIKHPDFRLGQVVFDAATVQCNSREEIMKVDVFYTSDKTIEKGLDELLK